MKNKEMYKYVVGLFSAILLAFIIIIKEHNESKIIYESTFNISQSKKTETNKVKKLQEENKDIVGYLVIPDTNIHEPVLQGPDNEFYLNHDAHKNKNAIGSIYLDYRVKINISFKNLIYGHNSSTLNVPFKELEKYYDKNFFKNHQYIYLEDENYIHRYQIFSVFIETQDWSYMKLNFTSDSFLEHLKSLKNKSLYETDVNIENDDEILILQTCSHHINYQKYKNKYLLVIAKKI